MNTSYFGNKKIQKDPNAVSIARYAPRFWGEGRRFIQLAPSKELLNEIHNGLPFDEYKLRYRKEVLDKLKVADVYSQLRDSILVCWEKEPEKCHRRIVAEWIENELSVPVTEI